MQGIKQFAQQKYSAAGHREFICLAVFADVTKIHRILHHIGGEAGSFEIEAIEQTGGIIITEARFYLGEGVGIRIKVIEFIGYGGNFRAFCLGQGVGGIQIDMSDVGFRFL